LHAVPLAEKLGEFLVPEPVLPCMAAAMLLSRSSTREGRDALQAQLAGIARYVVAGPAVEVADLHAATHLLLATGSGSQTAIRAVALDPVRDRLDLRRTVDGGSVGALDVAAVGQAGGAPLLLGEEAARARRDATDFLRVGLAAMLVGTMRAVLERTAAFLRLREQFGKPLAAFQALQHRAASAYVDITSCAALVNEAALAFGSQRQSLAAAMAKARASEAGGRVCREAVQMHGAIGFTDEHDIGLFLRRAAALAAQEGGELECLRDVLAEPAE